MGSGYTLQLPKTTTQKNIRVSLSLSASPDVIDEGKKKKKKRGQNMAL